MNLARRCPRRGEGRDGEIAGLWEAAGGEPRTVNEKETENKRERERERVQKRDAVLESSCVSSPVVPLPPMEKEEKEETEEGGEGRAAVGLLLVSSTSDSLEGAAYDFMERVSQLGGARWRICGRLRDLDDAGCADTRSASRTVWLCLVSSSGTLMKPVAWLWRGTGTRGQLPYGLGCLAGRCTSTVDILSSHLWLDVSGSGDSREKSRTVRHSGDSLAASAGWTTLGVMTLLHLLTCAWAQSSGSLLSLRGQQ